jgi:hypothetical protein
LSEAQFESVVYATMKFNGPHLAGDKRPGFFLGDGAGVGKGRQIAALIKQHFAEGGTRALWISVSQDLRLDAARDLKDLNADIDIYRGSDQVPKGEFEGVVFVTYNLLLGKLPKTHDCSEDQSYDSDFALKDLVIEAKALAEDSRLYQVFKWLQGLSDHLHSSPLIIFDEGHKAKNLVPKSGTKPSQTGRVVLTLQERFPKAKVIYASATGLTEPRNLAYMTRLGLSGFDNVEKLMKKLQKSNKIEALELAATSFKSQGYYLARMLSYEGAEFQLKKFETSQGDRARYNKAAVFWKILLKVVEAVSMDAWQCDYWATHQRFFRSMLVASKVYECVKLAKEAANNGHCVVIGLQSTGEAAQDTYDRMHNSHDGQLPALISSSAVMAKNFVDKVVQDAEKKFKSPKNKFLLGYLMDGLEEIYRKWNCIFDPDDRSRTSPRCRNDLLGGSLPKNDDPEGLPAVKARGAQKIKEMLGNIVDAMDLPPNPLDNLIDQLGGVDKVAEMTGRKQRLVRMSDGRLFQKQNRTESMNMKEK